MCSVCTCVGGGGPVVPGGRRAAAGRGRPCPAAVCAGELAQGGFKRGAEGGQGGAEMEMERSAQKGQEARVPGID